MKTSLIKDREMQITSHPNVRPGNREEEVHLEHNCIVRARFHSGDNPTLMLSTESSPTRDYCVGLSIDEMLRCLYAIPADALEKVIAEHSFMKLELIPPIVHAITAGAIKTAKLIT